MTNQKRREKKRGRARAAAESFAVAEPDAPVEVRRAHFGVSFAKATLGVAVVIGAALGLAAGAYHYALSTPRFAIDDLRVEGTRRLTREQVLAIAEVRTGQNVLSIDLAAAEERLLRSPWLESAKVDRRLPGSLWVVVTEREPRARALFGDQFFLVSSQGEPFKIWAPGDPIDLPIITGITPEALARNREAELEHLKTSVSLLDDYEHSPLAVEHPLEELHWSAEGRATLTVGDKGVTLHLGVSPFKAKLLRARTVLAEVRRQGGVPSVIFLDSDAHPERVIVRVD